MRNGTVEIATTAAALLLAWTGSAQADALEQLVRPLAQPVVASGAAVGVGVAVVRAGQPPRFFTYGDAALAATGNRPFTPDTLFQIGSVTKVFTTNLLGQAVADGRLRLRQPLSSFRRQLGPLQPLTGQVTLAELGAFTGGMADLAPICDAAPVPGCLPSPRPVPADYSAQAFAAFFRASLPSNYQLAPPQPVAALPAPYYYSDFSTGLIGLLLGGASGERLSNTALRGWYRELDLRLLRPLGHATHLPAAAGWCHQRRQGLRDRPGRRTARQWPDRGNHPEQRRRALRRGAAGAHPRRRRRRCYSHRKRRRGPGKRHHARQRRRGLHRTGVRDLHRRRRHHRGQGGGPDRARQGRRDRRAGRRGRLLSGCRR